MEKCINMLIKIIICIFMVISLTACRSAHELNKIAIVMGVGIDKAEEPNTVETTVQIAKVLQSNGSVKGGNGNVGTTDYLNLKENGQSISDTVKLFNRRLNRQLFFSHNQVVIFGEDAAREGIERYMDFFLRHRETRPLVWVLVAKGQANTILNTKPPIETTTARSIGELIRNEQEISQVPAVDLKNFASRLASKTTAPVAPMIEISKKGDSKIAYLSETAVFKKDKMVGMLNKMETRGLLWGTNKVRNGVVVLNMPNGKDNINVMTTRASSKMIPEIKDGKPSIRIEIKQEGDLQEQTSSKDLSTPKAFGMLQNLEENAIRKEVIASLEKAKELNADIFGFGDVIYKHYPKAWSNMEKNWDEIFKDIHVDVNVDARLRRTGRITKPIMSNEQ